MLGKLTKHEFLSIGRIALPSYIIVLVLALIGRLLTWLTSRQYIIDSVPETFVKIIKTLSSLISVLYVIVFFSILVLTVFMMIYRFYKNYFTDEGYLMLTLPVKTPSLIFSKLFNTWVWVFFSVIIAVLSLIITLGHYTELVDTIKNLWQALQNTLAEQGQYIEDELLGVPLWLFVVELVIFGFAYLTRFILAWYSSVSFGMLISKKHKVIGTLTAYLILFVITVIFNSIYLSVITSVVPNYYEILAESSARAIQIVVIGATAIHLLFSAGLFVFTNYNLKHKLNLD